MAANQAFIPDKSKLTAEVLDLMVNPNPFNAMLTGQVCFVYHIYVHM